MPKRTDISSILVIGAGPIIIGQACEFDYSGTQAIKALKEEGYRVVLVNSNPATIMTDPGHGGRDLYRADHARRSSPGSSRRSAPTRVLPTMGGQTALNTALALFNDGTLEKYGVKMIGADADAIDKAEDRQRFREAMDKIGLESARSGVAHTVDEAFAVLERTGLPSIIRPSFTLGGTGGGVAYNKAEFEAIVRSGLDASPPPRC
jgi:carbamoyl-phosphate synthase large subunit